MDRRGRRRRRPGRPGRRIRAGSGGGSRRAGPEAQGRPLGGRQLRAAQGRAGPVAAGEGSSAIPGARSWSPTGRSLSSAGGRRGATLAATAGASLATLAAKVGATRAATTGTSLAATGRSAEPAARAIAATADAAAVERRAVVIGSGSIDIGTATRPGAGRPSRPASGRSQSGAGRSGRSDPRDPLADGLWDRSPDAAPAGVGEDGIGLADGTGVRADGLSGARNGTPPGSSARRPPLASAPVSGSSRQRRSPGPPRAGPPTSTRPRGSARVAAIRGWIAFGATVTRISREAGGRARSTSIRAAPLATPRTSPKARKANSLAVKVRCPSSARRPRWHPPGSVAARPAAVNPRAGPGGAGSPSGGPAGRSASKARGPVSEAAFRRSVGGPPEPGRALRSPRRGW